MCYAIIPPCCICGVQPTTKNANIYKHFKQSYNRIHSEKFHIDPRYISICDDCIEIVRKNYLDKSYIN